MKKNEKLANTGLIFAKKIDSPRKGVPILLFEGDSSYYISAVRKRKKKGLPYSEPDAEALKHLWYFFHAKEKKAYMAVTEKSLPACLDALKGFSLPKNWKTIVAETFPKSSFGKAKTGKAPAKTSREISPAKQAIRELAQELGKTEKEIRQQLGV